MTGFHIVEAEILIHLVMAGTLSHFLGADDTLARPYSYFRKSQRSFVHEGKQPPYTDKFYEYESGTE